MEDLGYWYLPEIVFTKSILNGCLSVGGLSLDMILKLLEANFK